jgi:hypothetical protein
MLQLVSAFSFFGFHSFYLFIQWRNGGMAFGFRKMATAVIKPDR